jgi:hypothetical protein
MYGIAAFLQPETLALIANMQAKNRESVRSPPSDAAMSRFRRLTECA